MILASIHYHLFPEEAALLDAAVERHWHQIDGELRLEFTDAPACFVSWGSGPVAYAVEVREESFFAKDMLASLEMSDHPYWTNLIGQELRLHYADEDCQILKLFTPRGEVFLSSQDSEGAFKGDSLRVSPLPPH